MPQTLGPRQTGCSQQIRSLEHSRPLLNALDQLEVPEGLVDRTLSCRCSGGEGTEAQPFRFSTFTTNQKFEFNRRGEQIWTRTNTGSHIRDAVG